MPTAAQSTLTLYTYSINLPETGSDLKNYTIAKYKFSPKFKPLNSLTLSQLPLNSVAKPLLTGGDDHATP